MYNFFGFLFVSILKPNLKNYQTYWAKKVEVNLFLKLLNFLYLFFYLWKKIVDFVLYPQQLTFRSTIMQTI